jgi:hypothetical protein
MEKYTEFSASGAARFQRLGFRERRFKFLTSFEINDLACLLLFFSALCKQFPYDVLQSCTAKPFYLFSYISSKCITLPVIVTNCD